jgi:hypothetical protein
MSHVTAYILYTSLFFGYVVGDDEDDDGDHADEADEDDNADEKTPILIMREKGWMCINMFHQMQKRGCI